MFRLARARLCGRVCMHPPFSPLHRSGRAAMGAAVPSTRAKQRHFASRGAQALAALSWKTTRLSRHVSSVHPVALGSQRPHPRSPLGLHPLNPSPPALGAITCRHSSRAPPQSHIGGSTPAAYRPSSGGTRHGCCHGVGGGQGAGKLTCVCVRTHTVKHTHAQTQTHMLTYSAHTGCQ